MYFELMQAQSGLFPAAFRALFVAVDERCELLGANLRWVLDGIGSGLF